MNYHTIHIGAAMWAYIHGDIVGDPIPGVAGPYGNYDDTSDYPDDYYIGVAEGMRNGRPLGSRDITYGAFYPERMFLWGKDEDGELLGREALLKHLHGTGFIYSDAKWWDACRPWGGSRGGRQYYHQALRATTIGATWGGWKEYTRKGLPEGYHWDPTYGCEYGHLNVEV